MADDSVTLWVVRRLIMVAIGVSVGVLLRDRNVFLIMGTSLAFAIIVVLLRTGKKL